ncbi:hypothetical protein OIU77_008124 [Salix suchowensis]|uniref:Uncharacterized protein n=1 Tax=Salix suchowensis TaxID=1278906 RepID=A0ABQ9AIF0_9ROSI|nr:hypothetical protein OIU77_008124 [Salix suchowensis]KAJ6340302.1 hypothetical protein OIU77_008124 [Salix suchowensis]
MVWEWGWTRSAETWNGRAASWQFSFYWFLKSPPGRGFCTNGVFCHRFIEHRCTGCFPASCKRIMPGVSFVTQVILLRNFLY